MTHIKHNGKIKSGILYLLFLYLGAVNNDGIVNPTDAQLVAEAYMGLTPDNFSGTYGNSGQDLVPK
jgi:hypothetical protein